MRILFVALAAFGAGLLAGHVLFAQPDRIERTARKLNPQPEPDAGHVSARPGAERAARDGPQQQQQQQHRQPATAGPDTGADQRRMNAVLQQLSDSQARIRDLERELDFARRTAPSPEIMQEMERASVEELQGLVDTAKRVATARLLAIPEEIRARYASLEDEETAGFARLLPRGKYDELIDKRGGGAYFSFVTRKNDYNEEPDIELQRGFYGTSFYGGTFGFLIDVGELALDSVPRGAATVPGSVEPEAWRFLWETMAKEDRREKTERGRKLGLTNRVKAVPNHTYVLRAVLPREHDILVAFRAVDRDDHGHTLIFRELKRW